jgi:hypothetical protein
VDEGIIGALARLLLVCTGMFTLPIALLPDARTALRAAEGKRLNLPAAALGLAIVSVGVSARHNARRAACADDALATRATAPSALGTLQRRE